MFASSWTSGRSASKTVRRFQCALEALENRWCPSTLTWDPTTNTAYYSAAGDEANKLSITAVFDIVKGPGVSFSDSGTKLGLAITINCAAPFIGGNAAGAAAVLYASDGVPVYIEVGLGNLDDTLTFDVPAGALAWGGDGDDVMAFAGATGAYAVGGFGDDQITGSAFNDKLLGELGNDELRGVGGNDQLYGGFDNDELYGGEGNDSLYGEDGFDKLFGEQNDDYLDGGSDGIQDRLTGGPGADIFIHHNNEDTILDFNALEGDTQRPNP
jgi:Ca2+-binding RTX toxin-like protein